MPQGMCWIPTLQVRDHGLVFVLQLLKALGLLLLLSQIGGELRNPFLQQFLLLCSQPAHCVDISVLSDKPRRTKIAGPSDTGLPDLVKLVVLVIKNHNVLLHFLHFSLQSDLLQLELLPCRLLLVQLLFQILCT